MRLHWNCRQTTLHFNEFLIDHYIRYDSMRHIQSMHLKFGYFVLYTPIYRLPERIKKRFHVQNCPSRTVGRKQSENKHNRTRLSVFMHTHTLGVTIQGNITAMRYRNDVIWSVLLLHIRAILGMMTPGNHRDNCSIKYNVFVQYELNLYICVWSPMFQCSYVTCIYAFALLCFSVVM